MATYYVNLSLSGTGGDGSSVNPWHADTFIAQCNGQKPNGTVFMIKGVYIGSSDLTVIANIPPGVLTLTNWGSNPWVFDTTGTITVCHNSVVEHAFMRAATINCNYPSFKSSFIMATVKVAATNQHSWFRGCTVVAPLIEGLDINNTLNFESCIISGTTSGTINSDYTVFSGPLPSGTNTNYQINWTPPTWYFSYSGRYFNTPDYCTGITVPPNPGKTPYTGYEKSLWGSDRTGVGALYFPGTTYYVDLGPYDVAPDGYGTESSPWNKAAFETFMDECFAGGDIIKIKGSANIEGTFSIVPIGIANANVILTNWVTEPWRVDCNNGAVVSGTFKNGIIRATSDFDNSGGTVIDCYIESPEIAGRGDCHFKGCTLLSTILRGYIHGQVGPSQPCNFTDSIITASSILYFDLAVTNRCVFTIAAIPGSGTHTNDQVNWTPPTFPAWDDIVISNFNDTVLAVGITTPPQPGNAPYTGYDKGLWDSNRAGIGAMVFTGTAETYYADLDRHDAGGSGTETDPWHAFTFVEKVNAQLGAGSTVKVKGSYENTDDTISVSGLSFTGITIENWGTAPWRISTLDLYVLDGSTLKNAIINIPSGMLSYAMSSFDNCYIRAVDIHALDAGNYFSHCTLIASTFSSGNVEDGDWFTGISDSIIICPVITNFTEVMANNNAFTLTPLPPMTVDNQNIAGWSNPVFPEWDAEKEAFSSYTLSTGITSPPQPGVNPSSVGLWDSVRTGIGALYFQAAPVGTRYIAKVTANGWTKDNIYEYDGTQWVETVAIEGMCCFIKELSDIYIFHNGQWVENDVPWLDPVISIFDNTAALPVSPVNGDRYIAEVTANGWTANSVYEWNTNNWLETTPVAGMMVFNNDTGEALLYSGTAWVPFIALTAHAIGGVMHTASSVTDLKTKVSGPDILITSQAGEYSAITQKDGNVFEDRLLIEDSEDSDKKKRLDIGKMTNWLKGAGAPPSPTGYVEGTLYFKYTP